MRSETKEIIERLEEVLLNGRWIANTNYKEQISGLTWQQATQKIAMLNSIAALTYHINYYVAGLTHAIENKELLIEDKYSFDLPTIQSDEDWGNLVNDFLENTQAFIQAVARLPDEQWDATFIEEKYSSYRRNIEGAIEHGYYHLGQIVLIRKMITEQTY